MSKLTVEQILELENLMDSFEKYVNTCITGDQDYQQSSINNGEYKYLIQEGTSISSDYILPDELEELLENSTMSWEDLVKWAIENNYFKMEYESLSNPHHYGSAEEMEFTTVPWGGDREVSINYSSVEGFKPFFSLSDVFETSESFSSFVNENIKRYDYSEVFYDFMVNSEEQIHVTYNSDYDLVRAKLDNEEEIVKKLKSTVKKVLFIPKQLKITQDEYNDLYASHSGFCIFCGKINSSFHEPDASEYECGHCDNKQSYGIEEGIIRDMVIIVDEDESNYESSI